MAVEHWALCRREKFVVMMLLADSLEDEDEPLQKRARSVWARSWLKRRNERGVFHQLVPELRSEDSTEIANYFRIPDIKFKELVSKLNDDLTKRGHYDEVCYKTG